MKQSYLKEWFGLFPDLRFLLSKKDKEVLNEINPAKYRDFNLTRNTEVIRIIEDHKPQAWKWVSLYPRLKDLPAEDYAILDHIVPNDYVGDVTEEDVRRIIAYRKENLRKEKAKEAENKAKAYYRNNATAIAKEERKRTSLTKVPQWATVLGSAFITGGVSMIGSAVNPVPYFVVGVPLLVLPWLACSLVMKKLDANSVIPKAVKPIKAGFGFLDVAFIALLFIALIGVGILAGSGLVWERLGWPSAEPVFWTGLITIVGSAFLFVIFAIATPHRD